MFIKMQIVLSVLDWNEYITDTLSKYFDVTVTSVHADDCEHLGIWICYKEQS